MSNRGAPLLAQPAGISTRLGGKGMSVPYAPAISVSSEMFVATSRLPGSTFMDTAVAPVLFSLIDATSNTGSICCPAAYAATVERRTADVMNAVRVELRLNFEIGIARLLLDPRRPRERR